MSTREAPRVTSRFGKHTLAAEVIAGIDLSRSNAIVTGGASGIGIVTARVLAEAGAGVTIAARDLKFAQSAADEINAEIGASRVQVEALELGDLSSVRAFAHRWGDKPLSLLINNAGIMACPMSRTADGFEMQFGVNHLGHFLLSLLLAPALEKGAPSRLISLSSAGHFYGDVDFDDPNFERREYQPWRAYGQSKTANALFAVEFDRRFRDRGVRAFSVMPGVITTNLGRHLTPELRAQLTQSRSSTDARDELERKSVEAGAATSVWAATAPELDGHGGLYLEDCAQAVPFTKDLPRGKGVMPHALDPEAARRLWDLSEKMVSLK